VIKHVFRFSPKSGLTPIFGAVFFIFTAEILSPGIIDYCCKYGYIKEKSICVVNIKEPTRHEYSSMSYNLNTMNSTVSTASPSPSPEPMVFT